jgi:hypothetical protein
LRPTPNKDAVNKTGKPKLLHNVFSVLIPPLLAAWRVGSGWLDSFFVHHAADDAAQIHLPVHRLEPVHAVRTQ